MLLLTNEEKLYVLYTKGHFAKYKDAREVILSEVYGIDPKDITVHIAENFMVELYTKLAGLQAIEMNYENSIEWLLKEFRGIGSSPLAPKSLYDWLQYKIAHALPTNLDLDNVERQIERKMRLKQEWVVVSNCPLYQSRIFETEQEANLESVRQKKETTDTYFIPILKSNEFKENWVFAEPYAFIWSSKTYPNIYRVIEEAEDMYPGDFLIGQRIGNEVINIKRIQKNVISNTNEVKGDGQCLSK